MHKALHCTCSKQPPLLSPLFLISFDITQSLLLDLCLCNPLSLLLIGVKCNSFCSSVHLFTCIMPQIISLSISSCGASLLITVVWLMDLWILDLLLPYSSNFSCPGSFLFLPSPLILTFAICGWLSCQFSSIFAPLSLCWLMCHFVHWSLSDKLTFPLFLSTLRLPPSGSMGACSWSLNECDSCCCQVISREIFQLAQRHCCHFKW